MQKTVKLSRAYTRDELLGIIGSLMSKFSPNEKAVKQQVLTLVKELKNSEL